MMKVQVLFDFSRSIFKNFNNYFILDNYLPYDRPCKDGSSCTCRRTLDGNIVSSFVVYSVFLIFGIVFSLIMQAVNYRWRNNKLV